MSKKILLIFGILFVTHSLSAQEPPNIQTQHPRENTEWVISYSYNANDNKLPRVLLIGDSICNGYQPFVCEDLAGTAYVSYFVSSKCLTDKSYLRVLAFFLDEYDYEVIHFNNGLHSLSSNQQDWETCLRASIKLIKEKAKRAKIIWASSTPLKDPNLTAKAQELNAIAAKVMTEEGIPTDDLFTLMVRLDRNENWTDTFHFTEPARQLQAKAVADSIRGALGADKASETKAKDALKSAISETGPDGKIEPGRK